MGSILMLIVLVAAFSISGTMVMTVFHKRSEVGILRSLGVSRKDVAQLFLAHGITIGTVGVLFGMLGGMLLCVVIKYTRMIPLPEGLYYLRSLPVKFLPVEYCVIGLSALVFALIASVYPAMSASKQSPSEGVRCE
jgi:lipoprotein-releasing system permease protein